MKSECLYHEVTTFAPWRVTRCAHAGDRSIALYEWPAGAMDMLNGGARSHRARVEMHRGWLEELLGVEQVPAGDPVDPVWDAWLARLVGSR